MLRIFRQLPLYGSGNWRQNLRLRFKKSGWLGLLLLLLLLLCLFFFHDHVIVVAYVDTDIHVALGLLDVG